MLPCTFFISSFSFIHRDLARLAILFFIEFHRHNYWVIASDRKSVTVDVSLFFLTDTQPSALFSVDVYPSCLPSLLYNMISCVHWRGGSVSIDTDDNITVFAGTWRPYKNRREERLC